MGSEIPENRVKRWLKAKEYWYLLTRFEEIFVLQRYDWLKKRLRPKTVVFDLGANVGDTAIYFAMQDNVEKVVCYEPDEKFCKVFENYIKDNPYKEKIILYKKAINSPHDINTDLKSYKNVVVKCDVEGPEHQIFTPEIDLDNVYAIMLEYRHGIQNIEKNIAAKGFIVNLGVPRKADKTGDNGDLYAWREE
jgi:hypothetical protein